jgi:hypothetical protein
MLKKFLIGTFVALALMVTSVASAAYDFGPSTLKVGSKGVYVSTLQTFVGATSDGSFGPMTKAKVVAWQASNGLTADGLFGNLSKAKANSTASVFPAGCTNASGFSTITGGSCASLNANTFSPAGCTNASGFSPVTGGACVAVNANTLPAGCVTGAAFSATTGASCTGAVVVTNNGPLKGGAGSIDSTKISTDVETTVAAGQTEKVFGFKVLASDSDVALSNLKVTLVNLNTAGTSALSSYRLNNYASDVSIYMDGTKVGTASVADFVKDGNSYSKSIALSNAVVRMGSANKATFYVEVTADSTIDTGDVNENNWNITVDNIRFQDATGVVMTGTSIDTDNTTFVFASQASDLKLAITKGSSSPDTQNVEVSDTSSTPDLLMLEFKLKATGADVNFDQLGVTLTGSTGATLSNILGELSLRNGSDVLATESSFDNDGPQTVLFNLDNTLTVAKDTTTTLRVYAKVNSTTNFVSGQSVTASFASINAQDINGKNVAQSGAVTGTAQSFFSQGINASAFSVGNKTVATATSDGTTTSVSYPITFKVTAFGDSYYVKKTAGLTAVTDSGATDTFSDLSATNATLDNGYWLINDGDTATFTTTGAINGTVSAGFHKIGLYQLKYNTATTGTDSLYTFSPATSYETDSTLF